MSAANSADVLLALRFAEAELGLIGLSHPEFAVPDDADGDFEYGSSVESVPIPASVFEKFLSKQVALEDEFAESGYAVLDGFRYGLFFAADDDGNIICKEGAVIEDDEGRSLVIELDRPIVFGLIAGDLERPLADRIRVVAYLVGVACQSVRFSGAFHGFLREGVRRLRELVRLARLEEGEHTGDSADDAEG